MIYMARNENLVYANLIRRRILCHPIRVCTVIYLLLMNTILMIAWNTGRQTFRQL